MLSSFLGFPGGQERGKPGTAFNGRREAACWRKGGYRENPYEALDTQIAGLASVVSLPPHFIIRDRGDCLSMDTLIATAPMEVRKTGTRLSQNKGKIE